MDDWLIVDASVVVKAFVEEDGSEYAQRLWSSDAMLAAPAHALGEVGEVIRRKLASNEITRDQWHEIALSLPGTVLPIGLDSLLERAMEIAVEVSQSFYDCLYLAASERWGCSFVTADQRLVRAVVGTAWEEATRSLTDFGSIEAR